MQRLQPGLIVEVAHRPGANRRGVTVPDFMACCAEWETPVIFDGEGTFNGTPTDQLTVIGPENPVAEPKSCGAGRGAECCIFLAADARGFQCERHTYQRYTLIFAKDRMKAQREPVEAYPACKLGNVE